MNLFGFGANEIVEEVADAIGDAGERRLKREQLRIAYENARLKRFAELEQKELDNKVSQRSWRPAMMHTIRWIFIALMALPFLDIILELITELSNNRVKLADIINWQAIIALVIEPFAWFSSLAFGAYGVGRTLEKIAGVNSDASLGDRMAKTIRSIGSPNAPVKDPASYRRREAPYVRPATPVDVDLSEPSEEGNPSRDFDRQEVPYKPS